MFREATPVFVVASPVCFGFGDKVSRSRRLPSTRARLTLEPTRLATLLCASLPFCFFSGKQENLTARRNFSLPPPWLWLKLWVRLHVAARGRGGTPLAPRRPGETAPSDTKNDEAAPSRHGKQRPAGARTARTRRTPPRATRRANSACARGAQPARFPARERALRRA